LASAADPSEQEPLISATAIFLVQALVVLALPVALWRIARLRNALPLAVVQILVGVALGPSVLGRLAPELVAALISPQALAPLSGIATLAVVLFAFVVGLHSDAGLLRGRGPALIWIGIGSALLPTLLGTGAGLLLAHRYPGAVGPKASPGEFAAAVGICAGVTALPVLGAILLQMGLLRQRLGQLALTCAAINDALLWIFLAGLLAYGAGWRSGGGTFWPVLLGGPLYLLLVFGLVRPALARLATSRTKEADPELGLAAACATALGSAALTEALGLHHVLGAFFAGVAMPGAVRRAILMRFEAAVSVALMPFFFVLTGLRTMVDLSSGTFVAVFLLTTLAATLGKFGGTALLARAAGEGWPTALGLGALMQTKGLMEVVVLTVVLDAGLIGPATFSALVLMALVSTAATMPLARLVARNEFSKR
jgi:Kef-type K+ transport system membrane component KefB